MTRKSSFIKALTSTESDAGRLFKKIGGLEIDFFIQPATIFDVNDPENLSRVRVLFDENSTDAKSEWLPVLNSGKGKVSTQYVGAKCLVGAISGNSDNAIVLGLFNDTTNNQVISSGPVTIPIIDASDIANTSDPGVKCTKENEGRTYIFSSNVSHDLKVCVRRNNRQKGPDKDVWDWKNLTRGLVIEKETDPKQAQGNSTVHAKNPLPKCKAELEGESIQFSEDRDFRQIPLICKKDENNDWAWVPPSAAPTYFRYNYPKCTEKIHGQIAVIDDGNNSELSVCVRYDKSMKWVKYGTRLPIKFSDKTAPPEKSDILNKVKPNPNLAIGGPSMLATPAIQSPVIGNENLAQSIFQQASAGVVPGFTNEAISKAVDAVSGLTSLDSGQMIAQQLGARLLDEQGLSIDQLDSILRSGDLGTAQNFLNALGPEIAQIASSGDLGRILLTAGSGALVNALGSISSKNAGVFNSLIVGGLQGALDAAVQYGMDFVPSPANEVFSSVIGGLDLGNAPNAIASILNGGSVGGLSDAVNSLANGINFGDVDIGGLANQLTSGSFGDVGKIFQDFGNLQNLSSFVPGLPSSASALMGAVGLGGPLTMALPGGIGLAAATSLLGGGNPLSSILGGGGAFGALGGLFGGGGASNPCPCEPKCRKVSHGVDSDGNKLLDAAGNLTLDNTNVYGADPLNNNKGCLASEVGVSFTGIGEDLIPKNISNFTQIIRSIPRVNELSKKLEDAIKGGAEGADIGLEMVYSMEAIEKAFKVADNNVSALELIQRLELIGGRNFMNALISGKNGGLLNLMAKDIVENSLAVHDLYRMVEELNKVKDGGRATTTITPALVLTKKNPSTIPAYFSKYKSYTVKNLLKNILEALSILSDLDPELGIPFDGLETRNNPSKILNDSLSARFNLNQPEEDTVNSVYRNYSTSGINSLTQNQLDSGEFATLLDQINNEQERARNREGDCS